MEIGNFARCSGKGRFAQDHYFSNATNRPGPIPAELRNFRLSFVEEQLISLLYVNQYLYDRLGGSAATKGHCISFAQDITEIARELLRLASDVPIIIVRAANHNNNGTPIDLKVRRKYVEVWLRWLKANSRVPGYRNLVISDLNLNLLPVDGTIELREIESIEDYRAPHNIDPNEIIDMLSQSLNETFVNDE